MIGFLGFVTSSSIRYQPWPFCAPSSSSSGVMPLPQLFGSRLKNWVIDLMVSNEPPIRPYGSVLYDSGVALAPPAPLGRSTAPCWVIKNKARAAQK